MPAGTHHRSCVEEEDVATRKRLPVYVDLPVEIIGRILVCIPALDLLKLRAVCKTWRNLIDSDSFVGTHLLHWRTVDDCVLRENFYGRCFRFHRHDEWEEEIVVPLPQKKTIAAPVCSLDGLLLCCFSEVECDNDGVMNFLVWNPVTGELVHLPSVSNCYAVVVCHLMEHMGTYKVLLIYQQYSTSIVSLVLTLGIDNSWRDFPNSYQHWGYGFTQVFELPQLNGALHCVYDDLMGSYVPWDKATRFIAAFDIEEEKLREIKHPPQCCPMWRWPWAPEDYHSTCVVVLRGFLCLLHFDPEIYLLDAWFLEDYDSHIWRKDHSIDATHIYYELPCTFWPQPCLIFCKSITPYAKLNGGDDHEQVVFRLMVHLDESACCIVFVSYQPQQESFGRVRFFGMEFQDMVVPDQLHTTDTFGGTYTESLVRISAPKTKYTACEVQMIV